MILQHINWIDYVIIGIVVFSAIIGLMRGFVREVISLVSWVMALLLSLRYARVLQHYLMPWVDSASLRYVIMLIALFVVVVLLGMLVNMVVSFWISKAGFSLPNRLAGVIFGALRGVAIVVLMLLMLMNLGTAKDIRALRHSVLAKKLEPLAMLLQNFLPSELQTVNSIKEETFQGS